MKRLCFIAIMFLCITFGVPGQWSAVGGGTSGAVYQPYWDSVDQRLYVAGSMPQIGSGTQVNGIAYWSGGSWYALGDGVTHPFIGQVPPVAGILRYGQDILVAGEFAKMDSLPFTSCAARWADGEWHSMGIDSSMHDITIVNGWVLLDGKAHLIGAMDWNLEGVDVHSWAVWDGTAWSAGDTTDQFITAQINTIVDYQGQRYVGGNFQTPGNPNDLAVWYGSAWQEVGGGIPGDPWVNKLAVFDDLLWVCGEFYSAWGCPATGLMAWDGNQWLDPLPNIQFTAAGKDVIVANGKLFFSGPFQAAGLPGIYRFGMYDGQQVCVFGGNNVVSSTRMAASEDTLYAVCVLDEQPYNCLRQWPLDGPMDTCYQVVQGVSESSEDQFALQLYPNPASEMLTVVLGENVRANVSTLVIQDAFGRRVGSHPCDARMGPHLIDVNNLAAGCYVLVALDRSGRVLGRAQFTVE